MGVRPGLTCCCGPLRSSTPQEWTQFSQSNVARAHEALQASEQLREDTSLSRAQVGQGGTLTWIQILDPDQSSESF